MKPHPISRPVYRLIVVLFLFILAVFPNRVNKAAPVGQEAFYQENFETGQAQGWQLEPGWQVMLDGNNHVLAGQGHVWARSNQTIDGDYHLSFRLKLLQGRIHLVCRLNDVGRYFIGFTAGESDLNKQIWPDEFHENLASKNTAHSLNTWHQIEIVGKGNTMTFNVDGKQEWTYTDTQPLPYGSFAFETLENSQAYVDDIEVNLESTQTSAPSASTSTAAPTLPSNLNWVRLGGPLGGLGYDVRMRPDNPDIMFVTDAWAGVFMSRDGGASWFPSSDGITTRTGPSGDAIPVFSLTIDPNNPNIEWAGAQFQRGIFKSTDGGKTWSKSDSGVVENDGITFRGFSIQQGDSNIVYAAAEVSSWAWTQNHEQRNGRSFDMTRGVVYKTTNGGQSWKAVWRGENLARYVWINPQNMNIVYISTGIFDREAANSDPKDPDKQQPGGEGVLKSTDGGNTWKNVNNGLGNLYVSSLFMDPTNPDILLAGTGNNEYGSGEGVYLSLDGGNSWTQTLATSDAITSVEIAQSNPNIAYAGGRFAVYRSEDGGRNWQQVTSGNFWGAPGLQTGFPIDFQVDPRNPDRIFANAYGGGAFLSEDGGRTWRDASKGYTGAEVRDLVVDPINSDRIIAVARSGIFASDDGGSNWKGINPSSIDSIEWNAITVDPSNPQHLIGGLNVHGLLADSDDGGKTWEPVAGPYENRIGWRAIAFSPSDPKIVYAGTAGFYSAGTFDPTIPGKGFYISQDGGKTWSVANNSLSQDAHVTALSVDPANPQAVLAATINHGLLRTTDGGQNWTKVGGGISGSASMLSVAVNPVDANIVLAGTDRGGIYRSTDGGQTWKSSSSGLNPEASVSDILVDPSNPQEVVYLADLNSGVYRSVDSGKTWKQINNGLRTRAVNALSNSQDGQHLYAATEGEGVYRMDLNGQPPEASTTPTPAGVRTPNPGSPVPTTAQGAKPGLCGSAFALPLTAVGLAWWGALRKRIRR